MSNALEVRGFVFQGRRRAVDYADCFGLRRYGVKTFGGVGLAYHRFKCSATGADDHRYAISTKVTRSVLSSSPIPGRGEPAYLARDLRDAEQELRDAEDSIGAISRTGSQTPEQRRAIDEALEPYRDAVADAKAALEPYRTKFWWAVTQVRLVY